MTPSTLLKKLPKTIRIGAYDVRLKVRPRSRRWRWHGAFGEKRGRLFIELASHFDSTAAVVDTLKHEIIHAIYHIGKLGDRAPEEQVASVIATTMTQIEQDNRWLLTWYRMGTKR